MEEVYKAKNFDCRGAGASKNGGEAANFCEYAEMGNQVSEDYLENDWTQSTP